MKLPGWKAHHLHEMFKDTAVKPGHSFPPAPSAVSGKQPLAGVTGRCSKDAHTEKEMGPGSSSVVAAPAAGLPTSRFPPSQSHHGQSPLLCSAGPRHRSMPRVFASSSSGGCAVCLGPRWPLTHTVACSQGERTRRMEPAQVCARERSLCSWTLTRSLFRITN